MALNANKILKRESNMLKISGTFLEICLDNFCCVTAIVGR